MATATWTVPTLLTGITLTTQLNAITNTNWGTSGATTFDNATGLYEYGQFELVLASAITGVGNPRLDIFLLPWLDGTAGPVPPGTTAASTPADYWVARVPANVASFTRGASLPLILPPCVFSIVVQNNIGNTLPASGNTLQLYAWNEQSV